MAGKPTPPKPTGWGDDKAPAVSAPTLDTLNTRVTAIEASLADSANSDFTGAEIEALREVLRRNGWSADKETF